MNPADTDGNRTVSEADALRILDALQSEDWAEDIEDFTLDANRDGYVSARDALFVINRIETARAIVPNDESPSTTDDGERITKVDLLLRDLDQIGDLN